MFNRLVNTVLSTGTTSSQLCRHKYQLSKYHVSLFKILCFLYQKMTNSIILISSHLKRILLTKLYRLTQLQYMGYKADQPLGTMLIKLEMLHFLTFLSFKIVHFNGFILYQLGTSTCLLTLDLSKNCI